jgi:hypothetical protein
MEPLGTYSFLPYLRIGLANKIEQLNQDPSIKQRATFRLKLMLEGKAVGSGAPLTEPIEKQIQLYGPADIVGCLKDAHFKTEPRHWITNFEPNYLPYIELYEEDFPWRYTPSRPDALHRLHPWLALVVLEENDEESEFEENKNVQGKPLPSIRVDNAEAKFPPADQLWAWAHVHVNKDLAAHEGEIVSTNMNNVLSKLESALQETTDVTYSRILCPRKLKPNTAYHAFLIPSFEGGRQAGLGMEVNPDFASQYAWGAGQNEFPYFHRWYFRTSTVGDFEYLVRLLQAKPANEQVGRRDIDVQQPGWNISGLDPNGPLGGILKLGGALRVPNDVIDDIGEFNKYENWAVDGYPQPIQQDIAHFLNLADDYQKPGPNPQPIPDPDSSLDPDPLIAPPLYGRWHAAVDRLLSKPDGTDVPNNTNWIHELNLDPRFRVSAGFGTKVIQDKQEEYMHAAWQQVGEVLKANQLIRLAQLSSGALGQWYTQQLQPLLRSQLDKLTLLSAPVQKRILVENMTISHQIKTSIVPPVAVSAQMRKVLHPRARLVKKLPFAEQHINPVSLISRLNSGEVLPAPPKITSASLQTEYMLAGQVQSPSRFRWLIDLLRKFHLYRGQSARPPIFMAGKRTPDMVDQAPKSPNFRITDPEEKFKPSSGATDSEEGLRFKAALKDMYAVEVAAREAASQPPKLPLDLKLTANGLRDGLDPNRTLPRLVRDRILLPERLQSGFIPEAFDEIMNYPQFDLPMYKPLAELSSEYFLPNLNLIEQNSITVLEPNQKFIEAYMVGLNHEMARELLWREYPTDQRGSYFRQFWDTSAYLPQAGEDLSTLKEKLKDIPELHRWLPTSALGEHDNRTQQGTQKKEVVLVIRGELLKKYPTAVIYAHRADWQYKNLDGTKEIDNTKERVFYSVPSGQEDNPPRTIVKTPLYSAKIEPDIYFLGFDLEADEAKGSDGSHPDDQDKAGWFFVIKERPGEPRFGLDISGRNAVRHTWSDVSWEDAAPGLADNDFLQITDATPTISLTKPTDQLQAEFAEQLAQYNEDEKVVWSNASDSADLAYILYQSPVMVAIHASEMLSIK